MELFVGFIAACILLFLNDDMAQKRGRNRIGWFLFGLFVSPLLSMLVLWMIGDKYATEESHEAHKRG